jgi:hypothetical protein
MDLPTVLGYLSALYFIKPDMEPSTLIPTVSVVHLLDAILCCIIATNGGRNTKLWTIAGLVLGIWALGAILLLPAKERQPRDPG